MRRTARVAAVGGLVMAALALSLTPILPDAGLAPTSVLAGKPGKTPPGQAKKTPEPKPTTKPTPRPTAKPAPKPTPRATARPAATTKPTPTTKPRPTTKPTPAATARLDATTGPTGTSLPTPPAATSGVGTTDGATPSSSLDAVGAAGVIEVPAGPTTPMLPLALAGGAGLGVLALSVSRRRRDEMPPPDAEPLTTVLMGGPVPGSDPLLAALDRSSSRAGTRQPASAAVVPTWVKRLDADLAVTDGGRAPTSRLLDAVDPERLVPPERRTAG